MLPSIKYLTYATELIIHYSKRGILIASDGKALATPDMALKGGSCKQMLSKL